MDIIQGVWANRVNHAAETGHWQCHLVDYSAWYPYDCDVCRNYTLEKSAQYNDDALKTKYLTQEYRYVDRGGDRIHNWA